MPALKDSIKDALNDRILLVLGAFATLSLLVSIVVEITKEESDPSSDWWVGITIYLAIFLLVFITSLNDWAKDKQFVKLQSLGRDEDIAVIRGKQSAVQSINIWSLVVGDVIKLGPGDKVPADCLFLDGNNLVVDESQCKTGEQNKLKKDKTDPFIFADSYIAQGACRALVTCCGANSSRGALDTPMDTSSKTPLEQKLTSLSKTFTFIGIYSALAIFVMGMLMTVLYGLSGAAETNTVLQIVNMSTLALVIIMVAIPEGLPMTTAVSLAYSTQLMFTRDKVLVRDLEGPEKMGQVNELLIGKTGTLTTENMSVTKFFVQDLEILNTRKHTINNCYVSDEIIEILKESVVFNCMAHIEATDNAMYKPVGNGTDVSMLNWLQDAEIDINDGVHIRDLHLVSQVPFNTSLKRMVTVINHPDLEETCRVYVKGAPETVLRRCTTFFDHTGEK